MLIWVLSTNFSPWICHFIFGKLRDLYIIYIYSIYSTELYYCLFFGVRGLIFRHAICLLIMRSWTDFKITKFLSIPFDIWSEGNIYRGLTQISVKIASYWLMKVIAAQKMVALEFTFFSQSITFIFLLSFRI